jgi:hypothetical protein
MKKPESRNLDREVQGRTPVCICQDPGGKNADEKNENKFKSLKRYSKWGIKSIRSIIAVP